jgi:hypothetical protein
MYYYIGDNWSHRKSKKILKKNLEAAPGKHSIDLLQRTAILVTSHTIQNVLRSES